MPNFKNDGITNLFVKEVFLTLQGEGPLTGCPAVFVRLAGCNLKCWFCDTDFEGGERYTLSRLLQEVEELAVIPPHEPRLVVVTGGEPFAQNITPLIATLLGNKFRVQIETAGTLWRDLPESPELHIVVSPKTPKVHPRIRARATAWKYVIDSSQPYDLADGLPIDVTQDLQEAGAGQPDPDQVPRALAKPTRNCPVYLQPLHEADGDRSERHVQKTAMRCLEYGTD